MKSVRNRAFTLIELMVVVAIIAVLVAILLPSLGKAREMTKRVTCGTNLKAQGTAAAIYAAQNSDRVPSDGSGGVGWLWDERDFWGDSLLQLVPAPGQSSTDSMSATSLRKLFYCPSNTSQNVDGLWTFSGFRVMGYAYFNERSPFVGTINFNPVRNGNVLRYMRKLSGQGPMEFAFDAIIQDGGSGSFTSIKGGFAVPHTTSHLKGSDPSGQNVAGVDAHVEWRPWVRAKATQAQGSPIFWLVVP
jgi:prepilin-type N-terminal cleavage/methylation domain-containing protein